MAQEEHEVMYEKRGDVADMAGEDYELKVCALLVLRGVNHCPHGFYLASNHNHVGSFDDIVFLWRQEVGAQAREWRGMLLQLKHKKKAALGRTVFLPATQDQKRAKAQGRKTAQSNFSLVDYYHSYCQKVRPTWHQTVAEIGDVPLDQVTLGIFTNTGVKNMDIRHVRTTPDLVDTGAVKDDKEVSRISEITFSLNEKDVQESFSECVDQDDVSDFLGRFRLFCNQASLEKLKQLIKEELMVALGTGPGETTDGAYTALLEGVKTWWAAKNTLAPFLTASSGVWTDVVLDRMADLGAPLSSAVRALQLRYTAEAASVFDQAFSEAQGQPVVVVCERGCGLLAVGKARQVLDPDRGLAVSAQAAEDRLEEVCALLGCHACRWLLVMHEGGRGLSTGTRQRLLDVLAQTHNTTFVLVTETDGVPPDVDERWTRHNDQFSLLHLDDESQELLLRKTIIFQGMSTTVADIVQELNPNIEAPPASLLSRVINLMDSLATGVRTDITVSEEMLCLSLETRVSGFLFKFKFRLSPSDPAAFMKEVTFPLTLMVNELQVRVTQLYELLKKKDIEIQQYKLEGAQICRKSVETEPFKKEEFEKQFLTKDHKNVQGTPVEVITDGIIQLWKSVTLSHKINDATTVKAEIQTNIKEEPVSDDNDSRKSSQFTSSCAAVMTETHGDLQIKHEKDPDKNHLSDAKKQKKVLKRKLRL